MSQSSEKNLEELRRKFTRFDADNDGLLNLEEFIVVLKAVGDVDVPREVAELDFAVIDADGDGAVSFEEFSAWWLED